MNLYLNKSTKFEFPQDKDKHQSTTIQNLPSWNLDDLYKSTESKELTLDLEWLNKECSNFENDFKSNLSKLSADSFLHCLTRYEKIQNISGRIMSFAGLRYYQSTTDAARTKFLSDMQEKITIYSRHLVFFSLEINQIDDEKLEALLKSNKALNR